MSFEAVGHHWTAPTLEEESNMDVTLDRGGDEENNLLRPMPRSMADVGQYARPFEDEDMIDLSPRPSPPPDMEDDNHAPDPSTLPQHENMRASQAEMDDANETANDLDEITYDDDEQDDENSPSAPDATLERNADQDQHHDENAADPPPNEDGQEPDLIDYGDDDETEPSQTEPPAHEVGLEGNDYLVRQIDPHISGYPEAEGAHEDEKPANDAVHTALEQNESSEPSYLNQAYDKDDDHNPAKHAERSHHFEDHQKYSSHPIIVDYYNQWISLFKGSLSELDNSFDVEEEVLYGNISLTFEHVRKSQFVEVKEWEYLEIHVPALDLWIREKSDDADQYSFADLLNTYLDLHSHDGHYAPDPLFLTLTVRPVFRHQLEKLQRVAGSGGGFSRCDFLRSEQPSFRISDGGSGESGDDNEQYSQHYDANEEERDDPVRSAISNISSHPADPSSSTLTGQSDTPGELLTGEGEHDSHGGLSAVPDEEEPDEQQYSHESYDKGEDFAGEADEEDVHHPDQGYGQEYNESAENQQNSGTMDPFQGNDQDYQQYEDHTNQSAEDGGLELYGGDNQDFEHGYNHDAEDQTLDHNHNATKDDGEDHDHDPNLASNGHDENDGLAYVNEEQEYLQDYDQTADHQYYGQLQQPYVGDGAAHDDFGEHDQSHRDHNQTEDQLQSYGDHGQNGNLGRVDIDQSEGVEGEFLIDYSDTEEGPPQAEVVGQPPEQDQANAYEDDISYSDEEDARTDETPAKRPRADDDLETEPKRLKSEAG